MSYLVLALVMILVGVLLRKQGYFRKLKFRNISIQNISTWVEGRKMEGLAFLIGFLIAVSLRICIAYTPSTPYMDVNVNPLGDLDLSGTESPFCGINPNPTFSSNNAKGLPIIQDKVVFVTSTRFTLEQVSTLTKVAQSLFPVRDQVLWVIVSITQDKDLIRKSSKKNESELRMNMDTWKSSKIVKNVKSKPKPSRRTIHLTNLHKLLIRFSIPFVLMEKSCSENSAQFDYHDTTWNMPGNYWMCNSKHNWGTGVDWILKNIHGGVLMMGNEHFSYHHRIFKEVLSTNIASAWAVGLGRFHGFSAPIWDKDLNSVTGYFNGNSKNFIEPNATIPIEIGGAALRIEYLQQNDLVRDILLDNIVFQEKFTFESLSIQKKDIQLLGKGGSEILVWRTVNWEQSWPQTLRYTPDLVNTSIVQLWKNFLTVMFDQIPVDTEYREPNQTFYI